jgi:hypothetical protein
MDDNLIQKFGYSEMYEWINVPKNTSRFGKFVQFDKHHPNKICLAKNNTDMILGVTTVNSTIDSDNPEQWHMKNVVNEYGDLYLKKERLAVGTKVYDQLNEISYITTYPYEHHIPIENTKYDSSRQYVKRTNRAEWIRVNLIGKVIVEDNGQCVPGQYCTPYTGRIVKYMGTAVPSTDVNEQRFYVLERISKNTILILNK